MFVETAALLSASVPLAWADVAFTKPAAGDVIIGTSLVAEWKESNQKPPISTFTSYQLFLCAGGSNDSDFVGPLWNTSSPNTANPMLDPSFQPPGLRNVHGRQQVAGSSLARMGSKRLGCILSKDDQHECLWGNSHQLF